MQRSISFQKSFILLCLGLALWVTLQDWLLPHLGMRPLQSRAPSDAVASPVVGSVSPSATTVSSPWEQLSRFRQSPWLQAAHWGNSLSPVIGPSLATLLSPVAPLATFPQPQEGTGRLVIDLSDRTAYLYSEQSSKTAVAQYDIAVGQDGWETPPGRYLIEAMQLDPAWQHPLTQEIIPPGPKNPLGAAWISFLTMKNYSFGIHGTLNESLVGQAVSHGCIRMRNRDILALYDKVSVGWPLDVRP